MSRMIFGISFILVIASVFLISLAFYHPGLSESPANLELVGPQSRATLIESQAMSASAMGKVTSKSPTPPEPSNSGPTAQTIATNAAGPSAQRQNTYSTEMSEPKTGIAPLKEELKNRSEATETLKPQSPNGTSETLLVLGGKVFRPGQVEVSPDARESIGNIVPLLKKRFGGVVLGEGHSDSSSTISDVVIAAEENHKLSVKRAQAVAQVLEQQGIHMDRIVVRVYGDTRPVT